MVDGIIEEKDPNNIFQNTNIAKNLIPVSRRNLTTISVLCKDGDTVTLPFVGSYFKYESGVGNIRIKTTQGVNIIRAVGSAIRIHEFDKLYIENLGGTDDQKTFTIGFGEIKDNSVTGTIGVDEVQNIVNLETIENPVKIGAKQDVDSENEIVFSHGEKNITNGSQYGHVGLRNPAGSGVKLYIDEIVVGFASETYPNSSVGLRYINDVSILTPSNPISTNHSLSNDVGSGVFVSGTHTAIYGDLIKYIISNYYNQTGEVVFKFKNSIIVPPDYTFLIVGEVVGKYLTGSIEWREKVI